MTEKRDLRLDGFGISKHRYRELYNFCLQYPDFTREKKDCYAISATKYGDAPRGSGVSNPTAISAEKAYKLSKNIDLIESAAIEAGGDIYPYLLKAVTEGCSWEDVYPPCGRRQFYQARRRFFYLLNLKK